MILSRRIFLAGMAASAAERPGPSIRAMARWW